MEAGKMAQFLRVLASLLKDLGLIPSIHTVIYNHLELHFQGIRHPFLAFTGTRHAWYANIYTSKIPIHILLFFETRFFFV